MDAKVGTKIESTVPNASANNDGRTYVIPECKRHLSLIPKCEMVKPRTVEAVKLGNVQRGYVQ